MNVESLYVTDVHCMTTKKSDAKIGPQVDRWDAGELLSLAADCAHDSVSFRADLWADCTCPLIKHRIFYSLDHAHNVRMDKDHYNRRWMVGPAFSSIKRILSTSQSTAS